MRTREQVRRGLRYSGDCFLIGYCIESELQPDKNESNSDMVDISLDDA